MRFRILILALGTFAIGTDGFVIAGILPQIARGLHVSVDTTGLLITVFAWTYALGSPVLATMMGKVERKRLLLLSLLAFVGANVLAALATNIDLLFAARILAACSAALYTPTALAVAVSLVPVEQRGRALALVLAGLTVATVLGVPFGILIGSQVAWQATFGVVALLGLLAFVGILALFPAVARPPVVPLGARLAMLRRPALVGMLGNLLLWQISVFVLYPYLGIFLQTVTHVSGLAISAIFFLFGLASALGNMLGGYSTDHWGAARTLAVALVGLTVSEFMLPWAAASIWVLAITVIIWGIAGWMVVPPQQYRVVALAPTSSNVLLSLNGSVIYLGIGAGPALGALTLHFAPLTALGWVSGGLAAAALSYFCISIWWMRRGRVHASPTPQPLEVVQTHQG